jgi:hypothetical protein
MPNDTTSKHASRGVWETSPAAMIGEIIKPRTTTYPPACGVAADQLEAFYAERERILREIS